MNPLVVIEPVERPETVPLGQAVPLRVLVHRPADQVGSVTLPYFSHISKEAVRLNTDMLLQDIVLRPGESYALTVRAEFQHAGPTDLSVFYLQVNDGTKSEIVKLPDHPFRVVPNLARELTVEAVRVCGYELGVKVEVTIKNDVTTDWADLEVDLGPCGRILSGPTTVRKPRLRPGEKVVFEVITDAESLEAGLSARSGDDCVRASATCVIPAVADRSDGRQPFTFLEPRNLSHDRVIIRPERSPTAVPKVRGVYHVQGDKSRYIVTIVPNRSGTESVELLSAAGVVEIERMASDSGDWVFLMTVIEDPTLSTPVRLYYDLTTSDQTLRGELCLVIEPRRGKWAKLAMMLGLGVTVKGVAAILPALREHDGLWGDILEEGPRRLANHWSDFLVTVSVPVIFGGLWLANLFARPFEDD